MQELKSWHVPGIRVQRACINGVKRRQEERCNKCANGASNLIPKSYRWHLSLGDLYLTLPHLGRAHYDPVNAHYNASCRLSLSHKQSL